MPSAHVSNSTDTFSQPKFLPWNKGRRAECSVTVRYFDEDVRIVEDKSGDLFVYSRPVVPRELDI
jgi:hypothetical protein